MNRRDWLQGKSMLGKSLKPTYKYSIGDLFMSANNNNQYLEIISREYNSNNIPVYYMKNYRPHNEEEIDTMLKRGFWKEVSF